MIYSLFNRFTNTYNKHTNNTMIIFYIYILGMSVEGEFGCNEVEHPLMICVLDIEGNHWFLDGDYILQVNKSYNQHPYWIKTGYYLLSYYIFLHVNNNTNEWFWAITADKTFQDDLLIMAYCNSDNQNISEPSNCPQWNTTDYFNTGRLNHYSINEDFAVSAETCNIADRYICVQSNQSNLGLLIHFVPIYTQILFCSELTTIRLNCKRINNTKT